IFLKHQSIVLPRPLFAKLTFYLPIYRTFFHLTLTMHGLSFYDGYQHLQIYRIFFNKICHIIINRNSEKGVTMKYSPYIYVILIILLISTSMDNNPIQAEETNMYEERLSLYKKTEAISNVPWYYLAAMDQYERNKQLK